MLQLFHNATSLIVARGDAELVCEEIITLHNPPLNYRIRVSLYRLLNRGAAVGSRRSLRPVMRPALLTKVLGFT